MSLEGPKSTCFCALNAKWGLMGPDWFEDTSGKTGTVTASGNARSYTDSTLISLITVFKPTQTCMVHAGWCPTAHCR